MADNLIGPMAQMPLRPGMRIVLEALDPDTGAAISGVVISDVVISGVAGVGTEVEPVEVGAIFYSPGLPEV